jgi:hypothetical protein
MRPGLPKESNAAAPTDIIRRRVLHTCTGYWLTSLRIDLPAAFSAVEVKDKPNNDVADNDARKARDPAVVHSCLRKICFKLSLRYKCWADTHSRSPGFRLLAMRASMQPFFREFL